MTMTTSTLTSMKKKMRTSSSSSIILLLSLLFWNVNVVSSSYSNGAYGTNFFADSASTTYDGYQQAWRYLGHMVKCGYPSSRFDESEDSGGGSHEKSQDTEKYSGNHYCQRYLIWAAYVDKNYQGGGTGEYSYYDAASDSWDDSACNAHGNGRCAPMDCHSTNSTTWSLMGVYKEASYFGGDAFFEQLFKHEGICVWNDDDTYEFMSDARENSWPSGCVKTNYGVYLDLKPTLNGNMSYGLYYDEICKTAYTGSDLYVDLVAKNMGLLSGSSMDMWNDALETFKTCQPCRAYNLAMDYNANGNGYGYGGSSSSSSSSYYDGNRRQRERQLDGDYDAYNDPNEGYFQCNDDAGYTNVNQCMKFRSHADLEVATWEDLVIATEQGGILDIMIGNTQFGIPKMKVEEQLYMQQLRQKQIQKEEAEYRALVASVPSSKPIIMAGTMSMAIGALSLGTVLMWICVKACLRPSSRRSDKQIRFEDNYDSSDAYYHQHQDQQQQQQVDPRYAAATAAAEQQEQGSYQAPPLDSLEQQRQEYAESPQDGSMAASPPAEYQEQYGDETVPPAAAGQLA